MFFYKEQRNETGARGRYRSRRKNFLTWENNTCVYAMESDPAKGKKSEMQGKRGDLLEQHRPAGQEAKV